MSSATILFVLERVLQRRARSGRVGVMIGLGPASPPRARCCDGDGLARQRRPRSCSTVRLPPAGSARATLDDLDRLNAWFWRLRADPRAHPARRRSAPAWPPRLVVDVGGGRGDLAVRIVRQLARAGRSVRGDRARPRPRDAGAGPSSHRALSGDRAVARRRRRRCPCGRRPPTWRWWRSHCITLRRGRGGGGAGRR